MAERSKAPDSRIISFPVLAEPGLLVSKWRRGFESHFWQALIFFWFSFFFFLWFTGYLSCFSFCYYEDDYKFYLKLKVLCVIIPFKNNTGFAFFVVHFSKRSLVPALVLRNSNTFSHRTIKDHNYHRFFPTRSIKDIFQFPWERPVIKQKSNFELRLLSVLSHSVLNCNITVQRRTVTLPAL